MGEVCSSISQDRQTTKRPTCWLCGRCFGHNKLQGRAKEGSKSAPGSGSCEEEGKLARDAQRVRGEQRDHRALV